MFVLFDWFDWSIYEPGACLATTILDPVAPAGVLWSRWIPRPRVLLSLLGIGAESTWASYWQPWVPPGTVQQFCASNIWTSWHRSRPPAHHGMCVNTVTSQPPFCINIEWHLPNKVSAHLLDPLCRILLFHCVPILQSKPKQQQTWCSARVNKCL